MGTAQWTALKAECDAYLPGVVRVPQRESDRYFFYGGGDSGNNWINAEHPDIGWGYQGAAFGKFNGYWDSLLNLGVCYHTILPSNPTQAALYAAKGVELATVLLMEPGEMLVVTGTKAGKKRYVYDSTFTTGTAWTGATPLVNGAVAAGATTIPIKGLTPSGTLKAGDSFTIGSRVYTIRYDTTADGSGNSTVTLGDVNPFGAANTASTTIAMVDGTAITTPIVVQSYSHGLATGNQVTISGVVGNTAANGTWTVTVIDTFRVSLNGSAGTALQTNRTTDCLTNQGYGARFFGEAIALSYDLFYDHLSTPQKDALMKAAARWIAETERNGYGQAHPAGNYYAGQFTAKLFAALAFEGDYAEGDALWTAWYDNEWAATARTYTLADAAKLCTSGDCPGVQKYFNNFLIDSYHPDGSNYGWLATMNYLWAVLAVQSAKGIDLTTTPAPGFTWGLGVAKAMIHHTWPNRTTFNNRSKLFGGEDPARVQGDALYTVSGYLRRYHPTFAPTFQSYANEVIGSLPACTAFSAKEPFLWLRWNEFLYWNASAPATDYKAQPLSFYSAGSGELEMRSDWTTSGIWASLIAGPNVHSVEGGKDSRDRGSLVVTRGSGSIAAFPDRMGLVVNAGAVLSGNNQVIYADNYTLGEFAPAVTNTFHVNSGMRWRQSWYGPGTTEVCRKPNRSIIERRSEQAGYVYGRTAFLQDNFYPVGYYTAWPGQSSACYDSGVKPMTEWTRQVLYLRPKLFLVHDRTDGVSALYDRYLSWHTMLGATETSTAGGMTRYEVTNASIYRGGITVVLPAAHTVTKSNVGGYNLVDRLDVRPPSQVATLQTWLTAIDAASSSGALYTLSKLSGPNVDAVQVGTINTVAAFALGETLSYTYDATVGQTHYVTSLTPSTAYAVSTVGNTVSISPGLGQTADSSGMLVFTTDAGGLSVVTIQPSTPPTASAGTAYSHQFVAVGGTGGPYSWSLTGGSLPPGLSLAAGQILGVPSTQGAYTAQVSASDGSTSAAIDFSILVVSPAEPPVITTAALPSGVVGAAYTMTLAAAGGIPPYTWSTSALPDGLTRTGAVISGTPTTAGTTSVNMLVQDSVELESTKTLPIVIEPSVPVLHAVDLPIIPGPDDGMVGSPFAYQITATGDYTPFTWSISSGTICAGLSLGQSGLIGGVPTTADSCTFTVRVQDTAAYSASVVVTITVAAASAGIVSRATSGNVGASGNVR